MSALDVRIVHIHVYSWHAHGPITTHLYSISTHSPHSKRTVSFNVFVPNLQSLLVILVWMCYCALVLRVRLSVCIQYCLLITWLVPVFDTDLALCFRMVYKPASLNSPVIFKFTNMFCPLGQFDHSNLNFYPGFFVLTPRISIWCDHRTIYKTS